MDLASRLRDISDSIIAAVQSAWGGKTHFGSSKVVQMVVPYNLIELSSLRLDEGSSTVNHTAYRTEWQISRIEKERPREHPELRKIELVSMLRDELMRSIDFAGGILHELTEAEFAGNDDYEESLIVMSATFTVTVVVPTVSQNG